MGWLAMPSSLAEGAGRKLKAGPSAGLCAALHLLSYAARGLMDLLVFQGLRMALQETIFPSPRQSFLELSVLLTTVEWEDWGESRMGFCLQTKELFLNSPKAGK